MPNIFPPAVGTVLAFDFGEVRIGVAVGEAQIASTHPLETIQCRENAVRFARITQLIQEWQPVALVVGLPTHMDGQAHSVTALCRKFGHRLHGRFGLPVYWVDERLSSMAAEQLLAEAQVFGRKQKNVLDQVAAQAILSTFFTSGATEAVLASQ